MKLALPREETLPGVTASRPAREETGAARNPPCQHGPALACPLPGCSQNTLWLSLNMFLPPPLLPPPWGTLPGEKELPSTGDFEAVISSFIFQFPFRRSSASTLFPMPQGTTEELRGKKKMSQPAPGLWGSQGVGNGQTLCG